MDYGSAAGWEALSPPAPTDAPYRQADPGQSGESPVATRPSATVTADPNPVLTQSQNAGLNAILGLADHASVAIPEPGSRRRYVATTPAMPVRRAAVDVASFAPAPGQQSVLLRPTAHARRHDPVSTPQAVTGAGQDGEEGSRFAHLPGLALMVVILSVQAALSALFLHANTAFGDEALYLWAGHLEWSHWLHGTAIPAFPTWFSGSPAVYPPVGALADSIGGLAAARALSLGFMLGATCLLWATTARLFGRRAAFFAAGLYAVLGPTLHLGAFATFDAMAVFMLALAAWCACGARDKEDATGWMIASALALAVANAACYSSALFDPVVVVLAVLSACPRPGGKAALRRGALLITCLTGTLALLLRLGGSWYIIGISKTTTERASGHDPAARVLSESWQWTAVVVCAALAAVLLSLLKREGKSVTWLIGVLAAAALLVPAEQARIQTTVSLGKHVDFGCWFACIATGYALAALSALPRPKIVQATLATAFGLALIPLAATGLNQARSMAIWPGSAQLISYLRPLTSHGGHFLAETDDIPEYYLPATSWRQWSNTASITKPNGDVVFVHDSNPFQVAIEQHYFSVVVMSYSATSVMDSQITAALRSTPGYVVIKNVPFTGPVSGSYTVWAYRPGAKVAAP